MRLFSESLAEKNTTVVHGKFDLDKGVLCILLVQSNLSFSITSLFVL